MVLFREVYSWMRHLLKNDETAQASGIIVQEVTPMSASQFDTNDGARTLGLYCKDVGLSSRIEVRFAGTKPTVVWVNDEKESLVDQLGQTGFPGDWQPSYSDVSSVCEFLLNLAKEKFCAPKVIIIEPEVATASSFKLMDPSLVLRILDSLRANKSKRVTRNALNGWLEKQDKDLTKGGNSFDFAHSVIDYFKKGMTCKGEKGARKLEWEDIDILEDKFDPGHPLVEWSALKRWLSAPDVRGKLPPNILERVLSSTNSDKISQAKARQRMDGWLSCYVRGRDLSAPTEGGVIGLGQAIIAGLKSGAIPLTYLTQAELADPYEKLMPWSYLRRAVISYKVTSASGSDDLIDLIMAWLESSDLLLPLYQGSEDGVQALKKAIEAQINHHMDLTLRNPAWVNKVLDGYVGLMPMADLVRAVQVDFDLWLFNALSPSIGEKDLPLSPYAFSSEKRDQALYERMISCWTRCLKDQQLAQQTNFIQWLTVQLESFYAHVKNLWGKAGADYTPHMPSVARILEAVKTGDKRELLSLLVEDMEAEAGSGLPDSVRQELLMNPFFNAVYDAVRVQSVQLP